MLNVNIVETAKKWEEICESRRTGEGQAYERKTYASPWRAVANHGSKRIDGGILVPFATRDDDE